jgi:ABC-type Fe3+ transport system permease subunit
MTTQTAAATGALPAPKLPDVLGHVRHWWPAWLLSAVLGFLVIYPLGMLFVASIRDPAGALSVEAYARVFSAPSTYELIWTTIWLAAVRVMLASVIGVFLAWVVTRTDTPWRGAIETLVWIKFFAPPLPMIVAWTLLAGKSGLLNTWLQQLGLADEPVFNIYSYWGIIWVSTLSLAAFICLISVPAFRNMDASLEESARVSGVSRLQVLRYVTIPMALPTFSRLHHRSGVVRDRDHPGRAESHLRAIDAHLRGLPGIPSGPPRCDRAQLVLPRDGRTTYRAPAADAW